MLFNLEKGHYIYINLDDLKDDDFLEMELKDEIKLLKQITLDLDNFEKNIKEQTLDNMILQRKRLEHKYEKFHKLLNYNLDRQTEVGKLIDNYSSYIKKHKNENNLDKKILHARIKLHGINSKIQFSIELKELTETTNQKIEKEKLVNHLDLEINHKKIIYQI